ncbi:MULTISPECIES: response regulator transcription factor [unclassified Rathayibacter]|uniref:response regulator n=1 Tax=unclassified Rathayibacter TaxID=2609250 RepID=UPI000F4D20ED|nr:MULTISPECIES: response regulator transcription factor [unclassified Rathayibacter]ROP48816.1 LuxR family two component transcriptional regulator [Rathayibacter sp. PhB186]ROS49965.1 LuxR family two component transcriptional regulator [Rathayibacter sp. PhB185]TCL81733.1 LuxR family two component transcriptional regulator [Rathayibacter sp. PhB192]TCM26742.1 LuxR family two component transcriptional regulator [Rathayibacter sp. PhB179]
MIRVLLVDDHPIVRAGLRALIGAEDGLTVVGEAGSPAEAIDAAAHLHPDVVLMDLRFGADRETGVDATRALRSSAEPPSVLVLTTYDTDADILGAVEAGASGYLLKDAPPEELLAAIRAAAAGESALAPAVAARLFERLRSPAPRLSARETEVLALVAQGLSNTEVAARLFVTETTVKSHLAHVFAKLGVASRTAAVSAARRLGVLR